MKNKETENGELDCAEPEEERLDYEEPGEEEFPEEIEEAEFAEEIEDTDEETEEKADQPSYGKRIIAFLILVAFLAISIPNLSDRFLQNINNLLTQNQTLAEDEIVQKCKPAVVSIEATVTNELRYSQVRQGTGFSISSTGTIITNRHIVDGARTISVRFGDGRVFAVNRYELIPEVDAAVIHLDGNDLPSLELNLARSVQSGDIVTIIGNPLGLEKISQRGEVGGFYNAASSENQIFEIKIPINPGNSGSPVLDNQAKVVGVVFASTNVTVQGETETRALAIAARALFAAE